MQNCNSHEVAPLEYTKENHVEDSMRSCKTDNRHKFYNSQIRKYNYKVHGNQDIQMYIRSMTRDRNYCVNIVSIIKCSLYIMDI